MPSKTASIPIVAWLQPNQSELLSAVAERARLEIVAAGHPASSARASQSTGSQTEIFTDLRNAIATTDAKVLLCLTGVGAEPIASAGEHSPLKDVELIRLCQTKGITPLSLEPIPGATSDIPALQAMTNGDFAKFIPMTPLLTHAKVFGDALETLASMGQPRTLSLSFWSGPGQGSLGARLCDAIHLVHALLGVPESIDASVVTRVSVSGVRMEPGESLRNLRGDMTANLRFAGAKAASLSLSDRGGRWFRGASIVTDAGRVRLDESGLEQITLEGVSADTLSPSRRRSPAANSGQDIAAIDAFATAIARTLDPRAPRPTPIDLASVLATCEAAILSARTGQPESPATILRMAQVR